MSAIKLALWPRGTRPWLAVWPAARRGWNTNCSICLRLPKSKSRGCLSAVISVQLYYIQSNSTVTNHNLCILLQCKCAILLYVFCSAVTFFNKVQPHNFQFLVAIAFQAQGTTPRICDLQKYAYTPRRGERLAARNTPVPTTPSGWGALELYEQRRQTADCWQTSVQEGGHTDYNARPSSLSNVIWGDYDRTPGLH